MKLFVMAVLCLFLQACSVKDEAITEIKDSQAVKVPEVIDRYEKLILNEDHSIVIPLEQLADGERYQVVRYPINGKLDGCFLIDATDGECSYIANSDFTGGDVLEYEIIDAGILKKSVKVEFTIVAVNDAPVLVTPEISVIAFAGKKINLVLSPFRDVDSKTASYQILTYPVKGEIQEEECKETKEGFVCEYLPSAYEDGSDFLIYQVIDQEGDKSELGKILINISRSPDSDFDLIPDERDENRFVADLPVPVVKSQGLSTSIDLVGDDGRISKVALNYGESSATYIYPHLVKRAYSILKNKWNVDFDEKFLRSFDLGLYEVDAKKKVSEEVSSLIASKAKIADNGSTINGSFSLSFAGLQAGDEISNIELSLNLILDGAVVPLKRFIASSKMAIPDVVNEATPEIKELVINKVSVDSALIAKSITNPSNYVLSVENYTIKRGKWQSTYQDISKNLKSKCARIILSNETESKVHYLCDLEKKTLRIALADLTGGSVEADENQNILSLNGVESEVVFPFAVDLFTHKESDLNVWQLTSSHNSKLDDPIKSGDEFYLVYTSLSDLVMNDLKICKEQEHELCGVREYQLKASSACGVLKYVAKASAKCPVLQYKYQASEHCGFQSYVNKATDKCPPKTFISKASKYCGVKRYNVKSSPACKPIVKKYKNDGKKCGYEQIWKCPPDMRDDCGYVQGPAKSCEVVIGYEECAHESHGVAEYKTCEHEQHGVAEYYSCEHPSHGTIWNSCRHEKHGVESYQVCENESHGVAEYKMCRDASHGVESYFQCLINQETEEKCL